MASLFPPWSTGALRLVLVLVILSVAGLIVGLMVYVRSPYNTFQFVAIDQPVEFDHRHHVRDDAIDCLYCHPGAETSAYAGVPSTDVCMGCHNQIWNNSPLLAPVRQSYFSGESIPWNRVYDLPDFVYFNHAVHTRVGIGCVECHGRVDRMARVYKVPSLSMGWCLGCHRDPAAYLRGRHATEELPASMWTSTVEALLPERPAARVVTPLTTCSACHR
jgi:hypothetical protein